MNKRTVIIGASTNPARYSFLAAEMLTDHGHEIIPLGVKKGMVFGQEIVDIRSRPTVDKVDTITLYIGPARQPEWYDYIVSLNPKRVIFNPGTENPTFLKLLNESGCDAVEACTLVMLRTGQY